MRKTWIGVLPVMALLIGCQSSSVVKKSKSEMLLMEQKALMARQFFDAGDYDSAQEQLVPLCEDRHVNQTLYKCELASSYLLDGEKDKAHRTLLEIHESIEGFFDAESEKKAASLWGKESSKVYKGDPYERGTLYFLLSLSMLERGDVDNALAALKTGLLADSDTEEQTYTADFGLLQLVAAKCYALRGEDEMSDQMLGSAFDSFISVSEISTRFANELKQEYNRKKIRNELVSPPSNLLARLCALASAEKLTLWLQDSGLAQEECVAVAKWAKYSTASMMPLDFNALVIIWNGEAPTMSRAGEYGEKRLIREGTCTTETTCSFILGNADYDPCGGFGDLNYQATTRGGRVMDDVLSRQAAFKGTTDATGDMALDFAQQDYGDPIVNAGMLAVGLVFKGISAATKTEADIRCWNNLPHSFEIIPLKLPPGTHQASIRQWKYAVPLVEQTLRIEIDAEKPLAVLHARPPVVGSRLSDWFLQTVEETCVYSFGRGSSEKVDTNGDGEITKEEQQAAYVALLATYDADGDGVLSVPENQRMTALHTQTYNDGMVAQ